MSTLGSRPRATRSSQPRKAGIAAPAARDTAGEAGERSLGLVLEFMRTLWAVDHALFAATKIQRQRLGITLLQRLVLRIVARTPGISPGELSAVLNLHPSTVSGVVKRLSRSGLLVREIHSRDARRAVLTLTSKGKALGSEPGPAEALVQGVLEVLHPSDVAVAEAVLRAVTRALHARQPNLLASIARVGP